MLDKIWEDPILARRFVRLEASIANTTLSALTADLVILLSYGIGSLLFVSSHVGLSFNVQPEKCDSVSILLISLWCFLIAPSILLMSCVGSFITPAATFVELILLQKFFQDSHLWCLIRFCNVPGPSRILSSLRSPWFSWPC